MARKQKKQRQAVTKPAAIPAIVAPVGHSPIGASSMYRWSSCPGSVRQSLRVPPLPDSPYALEGTKAHEIAAEILRGHDPGIVSAEMMEPIRIYTDFVQAEFKKGYQVRIEHSFDLGEVHPGLFGTCDAISFAEEERTLRVIDYKHGAGIPVEVEENLQLMYYGLGALLSTNFLCNWVELVIVQPRCPHPDGVIRKWRFPTVRMIDFQVDLKDFAVKTEDPFAPLVPGDHCRFCSAQGVCEAVASKAKELAQQEFGAIEAPAANFTPEKLATTLEWLSTLEHWVEGVREFAYALAERGQKIPGWKLVAKRATRKWADEAQVNQFLESNFHEGTVRELFDPPALKSVAQVEKVLHAKQFEKLAPLVSSISSGNVLVPVSDKRPEIIVVQAKEEFGSLEADPFS